MQAVEVAQAVGVGLVGPFVPQGVDGGGVGLARGEAARHDAGAHGVGHKGFDGAGDVRDVLHQRAGAHAQLGGVGGVVGVGAGACAQGAPAVFFAGAGVGALELLAGNGAAQAGQGVEVADDAVNEVSFAGGGLAVGLAGAGHQ